MKTYEITEERIKKLHDNEGSKYVKEWYPEVFESKLENNRWYKMLEETNNSSIIFIEDVNDKQKCYGFTNDGCYFEKEEALKCNYSYTKYPNEYTLATESEVLEALKNEAVKKYKVGDYVNPPSKKWSRKIKLYLGEDETEFIFRDNELLFCGVQIFEKGEWATIIPTYTKEEAEKMLNAKIV